MHAAVLALLFASTVTFAADKPVLMRQPTVSRTSIAFSYAGDLWIVGREGGEARRLTTNPGIEKDSLFSPDGKLIAFTGQYDGPNSDVYVVPAAGGVPKRLTYHPGSDTVAGWTPDGRGVLFRSDRDSYSSRFDRLFVVSLEGGLAAEVPLPMAHEGAYSADGARIAYVPLVRAFGTWKKYRGGQTTPIWIANLSDSHIEAKIPRDNSNDFCPMWVGDRIYFLSDRNGPVTLFAYDIKTGKVTELIKNNGLDIKSASASPDAIVYEQFGGLFLYDLKTGKPRRVPVQIAGDMPFVRETFEKLPASQIWRARISPSGVRAVFEARGEIFTVPVEKGDVRNLTNTPGIAERDPSWSPDGKRIAYFSDEGGEYSLHLRAQNGLGVVEKIRVADKPTFYYAPAWSPDSKKICYTDKALNLWYMDLEKKTPIKVDTDTYRTPGRSLEPVWSPDSRWIAYTKQLKNHFGTVFVYSLEEGKPHQITDGMSDAREAQFDKNGELLYFMASTDAGPASGWLYMSSMGRTITRSVYAVVLRKDLPSPVAPESDEEKGDAAKKQEEDAKKDTKAAGKEPVHVRIDFDDIGQRVVAMPIPARNYGHMRAGKAGILYLLENQPVPMLDGQGGSTLQRFDLKTRKTEKFAEEVQQDFDVSANGEKLLYAKNTQWFIVPAGQATKPGEGALKIQNIEMRVDPRVEWKQIYDEVWRIERDFLYDPNSHGLDLNKAKAFYAPYLESVAHRADLNYLISEMLGQLSLGHTRNSGGAMPERKPLRGGLLGTDYKIENGRYRFARVYNGENWNPQLRAPLTQPGVNVAAGDYLLAVNGREVRPPASVYSFFQETAGVSVVLRVGPDPGGANSREITVVPVEDESNLRHLAWIEENRRKVDRMSGGRLAYVYLSNTSVAGFTNFNRYYFAQVDKEGAVIDERFNSGGSIADYIIDHMRRPRMSFSMTRDGLEFPTPVGSIFGPKAMIINEYAGSGGDVIAWLFRNSNIGPLIGKRTWGGMVGNFALPLLIDGGLVTAPNIAFYNLRGEWELENRGVAPDIEVEADPQAMRNGSDPQLEKAVQVVLEALNEHPLPKVPRPAFPNYHKADPLGLGRQ